MFSLKERIALYGVKNMSDSELLAIATGLTSLDAATEILCRDNGRFLLDFEVEELSAYDGIGPATAYRLKSLLELSRRLLFVTPQQRPEIRSPKDAADLLQGEIGFLDREAVRAINLDYANQVIAVDIVSLGGLASASAHPREVFKAALKRSAAAIILLHNHPSGDLKPSCQDIEETQRLSAAGDLLGIRLFDHIILSHGKYHSLLEVGQMPEASNKTLYSN